MRLPVIAQARYKCILIYVYIVQVQHFHEAKLVFYNVYVVRCIKFCVSFIFEGEIRFKILQTMTPS